MFDNIFPPAYLHSSGFFSFPDACIYGGYMVCLGCVQRVVMDWADRTIYRCYHKILSVLGDIRSPIQEEKETPKIIF